MAELNAFLESHGYWLLVTVGFAEFIGVPVASLPVLVTAGAFAALGSLHLAGVVAAVAFGGLVADTAWYFVARWRGAGLLSAACALTSNARGCILRVEARMARLGTPYILLAKFVPGAGNLVAPAAGFLGLPARRFLIFDALALVGWAGAYASLGWVFAEQVEVAVELVLRYSRGFLIVASLLIGGALLWRLVRFRRHREAHAAGRPMAADGDMFRRMEGGTLAQIPSERRSADA